MFKNKQMQSGFTLIEMMVVVGILAILAAIAYPSYQNYLIRARLESARGEVMDNIRLMEEHYGKKRTMCETTVKDKEECDTMPTAKQSPEVDIYNTNIIKDPTANNTSSYIITSEPKANLYSSNTLNNKEVYLLYYSNGSGFVKCTKSGFDAIKDNSSSAGNGCVVL